MPFLLFFYLMLTLRGWYPHFTDGKTEFGGDEVTYPGLPG